MVMLATYIDENGARRPVSTSNGTYAQQGQTVSSQPSKTVKNIPTVPSPVVNPAVMRPTYTPNQATAAQLAGNGGGYNLPQWMFDNYARKIGQMGGNANAPLPFGLTQSGFPYLMQNQGMAQNPVQATGGMSPQMTNATLGMLNGGLGASNAMQSIGGKTAPTGAK